MTSCTRLSVERETEIKILADVLFHPSFGMRIGYYEGEWVLSTGVGFTYEELARHQEWSEFIKLVAEYSKGDENG